MAEQKDIPQSISLEGKLGFEAQMSGGSAFGQLTGAFTNRLNQEPQFADVLQQFVGYTRSEKTRVPELRFNGKSDPKLLSEELVGKWVALAAEHTLLDAKKMPNETDGARWIALEGEVARLEDAILLAHRGKKSVTLDERFIKIIADPSGDTQQRIADSLDGVAKTLSTSAARATLKVLPVVVAGEMLFSACTPIKPTITPEATRPIVTQPATLPPTQEPIPSATPSGPEATPIAPSDYPSSVSVEQVTQARTLITDAPPSITTLAEVQAIINKHTELARQAGLTFDHMEVEYVASIQRWYLYPADSQGNIVGWLQIEDPTSQTGWRYAEQPTWDSQFHPSQDTFQFGLPALRDPQNHFEMVVINGFPILVEVTPDGKPQYWNNITLKQIMTVDGAVLPTEVPAYKPISEMASESECSQNIIRTDHLEEDIARMIKQMEQNQEYSTGVYIDGWYGGLPYPVFQIRLAGLSPTQIKFCGMSEDKSITYVAIETFPIRLGHGADVRYEYIPAVIALDMKALQTRSQYYEGQDYFTAHMSLKSLFEQNTGEMRIGIMGDRDNNGASQTMIDAGGSNPGYITLIERLVEDNDLAKRLERLFTGQATEEEIQWWKDFLQKNPIPGYISVNG